MLIVKREKECAVEELIKAQDTISRLRLEKSTKSIDLYDPNNPEILHRKLSKIYILKINLLSLIISLQRTLKNINQKHTKNKSKTWKTKTNDA